jgi:branched-subunit amino acid aminotransferase/4-amino-4-deoxychorismate lyase
MPELPLPSRSLAYCNGRIVPLAEAAVSVFDSGFLLGVTVAEQLRTFGGELFRLDLHLARLARSLGIVGIDPGLPLSELGRMAEELVEHNRALLAPADDQQATIFVTPGISPTYADVDPRRGPTVWIHTQPLAFGQWADKYRNGESLRVTHIRQVPSACWPPELKCRSRMHYYLADHEARETEPGARALLLDERGFVTEASTANVVAYWRDVGLVSPPKEHILPGVSVAVLEELAETLGIPFSQRELVPAEIAAADEVLLASTSPCVWSVTRLDGRPIGDGRPGEVSERLRAAWSRLVNLDIAAQAQQFASRAAG